MEEMFMKHHSLLLLLGTTLALASCQTNPEDKNIQVVATLFPQYSIAETLVGDLVDVTFLLENGGSLHGYEPTPSQVVLLNTAEVVLYTGEFIESWMHQIEDTASGTLVDVSTGITFIEGHDHHDHEDEEHDDHEDEHHEDHEDEEHDDHGDYDPHYWIDPANAITMVNTITASLIELLPSEALLIQSRQANLIQGFTTIVEEYDSLLLDGEELDIVFAGHNVFGYLETYGIHVLSPYDGFSDDVLPTPESLIEFVTLIETLNANYLFVSSTDNQAIIDALLEAYPDLETKELFSMETLPSAYRNSNLTYEELLLMNYEAIASVYAE
jgi:zinc transport system substrate-binding protein